MMISLDRLHDGMYRQVVQDVLSYSVYRVGGPNGWRWAISLGGHVVAGGPAASQDDATERLQAAVNGLQSELETALAHWIEAQKGGA